MQQGNVRLAARKQQGPPGARRTMLELTKCIRVCEERKRLAASTAMITAGTETLDRQVRQHGSRVGGGGANVSVSRTSTMLLLQCFNALRATSTVQLADSARPAAMLGPVTHKRKSPGWFCARLQLNTQPALHYQPQLYPVAGARKATFCVRLQQL